MISIPGRIPVHIHPLFWILIILIGWLNSSTVAEVVTWSVVIFVSILIHEYGHALTALSFGQKAEISLVGLGGLTSRSGPEIKPWQEFLIVMNGPLAGFALFFIASKFQPLFQQDRYATAAYALTVMTYVNFYWTILNLLPVLPLDGGHLMRIILEKMFGFQGVKIALFISIGLGALLSIFFFFTQLVFMAALFMMMAFESYRAWSETKRMSAHDRDDTLQHTFQAALEDMKAGNSDEALSKLLFLREQTKSGLLFASATQYIARILAEKGQLKQAYEWLLPLQNQLSPDYQKLLQQLAYKLQEWEQAAKIGTKAYQTQPSSDIAVLNACSYAILGQAKPAVGWLRCAVELGLSNPSAFIQKREFDAIRNSKEFQHFWRSLSS
jgi:stage IV sporulation protein FB